MKASAQGSERQRKGPCSIDKGMGPGVRVMSWVVCVSCPRVVCASCPGWCARHVLGWSACHVLGGVRAMSLGWWARHVLGDVRAVS